MSNTFKVIGENIHTTRVLRRKGRRISALPDGTQAVNYRTKTGDLRHLPIPKEFKKTQDYEEGRVKHVQIAVRGAMDGADQAAEGLRYLHRLAERQEDAGAHFLDLNVDEISLHLEQQQAAMRWLVNAMKQASRLPLSIDSSNVDIIRAGPGSVERRPRSGRSRPAQLRFPGAAGRPRPGARARRAGDRHRRRRVGDAE